MSFWRPILDLPLRPAGYPFSVINTEGHYLDSNDSGHAISVAGVATGAAVSLPVPIDLNASDFGVIVSFKLNALPAADTPLLCVPDSTGAIAFALMLESNGSVHVRGVTYEVDEWVIDGNNQYLSPSPNHGTQHTFNAPFNQADLSSLLGQRLSLFVRIGTERYTGGSQMAGPDNALRPTGIHARAALFDASGEPLTTMYGGEGQWITSSLSAPLRNVAGKWHFARVEYPTTQGRLIVGDGAGLNPNCELYEVSVVRGGDFRASYFFAEGVGEAVFDASGFGLHGEIASDLTARVTAVAPRYGSQYWGLSDGVKYPMQHWTDVPILHPDGLVYSEVTPLQYMWLHEAAGFEPSAQCVAVALGPHKALIYAMRTATQGMPDVAIQFGVYPGAWRTQTPSAAYRVRCPHWILNPLKVAPNVSFISAGNQTPTSYSNIQALSNDDADDWCSASGRPYYALALDYGQTQRADTLIIGSHNFEANSTVTMVLFSDTLQSPVWSGSVPVARALETLYHEAGVTEEDYDDLAQSQPYNRVTRFELPDAIEFKSVLLLIPTETLNEIKISSVVIGKRIEPTQGFNHSSSVKVNDNSTVVLQYNNSQVFQQRRPWRTIDLVYEHQDQRFAMLIQRLREQHGISKVLFLQAAPVSETGLISHFSGFMRITNNSAIAYGNQGEPSYRLTLDEVLQQDFKI